MAVEFYSTERLDLLHHERCIDILGACEVRVDAGDLKTERFRAFEDCACPVARHAEAADAGVDLEMRDDVMARERLDHALVEQAELQSRARGLRELRFRNRPDDEDRLFDARIAQRQSLIRGEDAEPQSVDAGAGQGKADRHEPVAVRLGLDDRAKGRRRRFFGQRPGVGDKRRTVDFEPRSGLSHDPVHRGRNPLSKPEPPGILGLALNC